LSDFHIHSFFNTLPATKKEASYMKIDGKY
jgi:hypothetical protein